MGFVSGEHDGLGNMLIVEIILNNSGCMRSCIVVLQKAVDTRMALKQVTTHHPCIFDQSDFHGSL